MKLFRIVLFILIVLISLSANDCMYNIALNIINKTIAESIANIFLVITINIL